MATFMRHVKILGTKIKITHLHTVNHTNSYHSISPGVRISVLKNRSSKLLQKHVIVCTALPIRNNSSGNEIEPTIAELRNSGVDVANFIPEPPSIPEPSTALETLNALGEPTLSSLGLANWTPPGFIQWGLENLHVGVGLPWWGCVILGTVFLRLAVFPIVIKSQKNAAHMSNHMPTMTRLQTKFSEARSGGNPMEAAKAGSDLMEYMKRHELKPFRNFLMPLAQMPIFLSVFIGIRKMANLPVESMQSGGFGWITDLTLADPLYALPLMTMATFLITIEVGVDGVQTQQMGHIFKWVMRGMPVVMFPIVSQFPAALCLYWFTSNVFSLAQVSMLKIPAVREYFNIPVRVKHDESMLGKKKGFREGFKDAWDNSKTVHKMEQKQRMEAVRFKQAGVAPIQKTYSYDPTKPRQKQLQGKKT